MTARKTSTELSDDELLARFVFYSRWIRNSDQTVRPDAFIPHPYPDLSVTRHTGFSEQQIWNVGWAVAVGRTVTLYGRADIFASKIRHQSLDVLPDPVPENQNHATILGWPKDKSAQKSIALQLAANSQYRSKP